MYQILQYLIKWIIHNIDNKDDTKIINNSRQRVKRMTLTNRRGELRVLYNEVSIKEKRDRNRNKRRI